MVIGAVADVHGNFGAMIAAMERHSEVPFWICVGDLASRTGAYPEPPAPLYWIKGNNEDFAAIARWEAGEAQPRNLHYIRNGTAVDIAIGPGKVRPPGSIRVAGLGGTFAPTWYDTPAAELPAKAKDDKRRHFVREEAEACKQLTGVDVLMTHEAPKPFFLMDPSTALGASDLRAATGQRRGWDVGKSAINGVLAAVRPRLHLCGHHHRFMETTREGVPSVCIDRVNRSYLLIDAATLEYEKVDQPVASQ